MVDGTYRFSLDIFQVADLGIRIGKEYTEDELTSLEDESVFGKTYARALEYVLMRPHSGKEVKDYLYRKTMDRRTKTGELKKGITRVVMDRVFERLTEKGYIDDEKFARFWIENRNMTKGISYRKLSAELASKGIKQDVISQYLAQSERSQEDELKKMIAKKQRRYPDEQKFMQYLARQGFGYDEIKSALGEAKE